jgi:RNA polymerase sigma-70 factor (ECF subfamily)
MNIPLGAKRKIIMPFNPRSEVDTEQPRSTVSNNPASESFETLFQGHWQLVYRILVRLVGDSSEAEDLALETFLRMQSKLSSFPAGFSLEGWLYRVATNLGLNAIRDRKRRERYELEAGRVEWLEHNSLGPAEIFAQEEAIQRARAILSEMNERQAQLLILRYSGKSYKEIAALLDVSASSIGPLLARAEREFEKRYRVMEEER